MSLFWRVFLNALFFFICFMVSFYFASDLYKILQLPFNDVMRSYDTILPKNPIMLPREMVIVRSPKEFFLIYAKISLFAVIVVSLPLLLAQFYIYKIHGHGITKKYSLLVFYLIGLCLVLLGLGVGYFLFVPLGLQFFASMLPAEAFLGLRRHVLFLSHILDNELIGLLAIGLLFQFPVVLWVLGPSNKKL